MMTPPWPNPSARLGRRGPSPATACSAHIWRNPMPTFAASADLQMHYLVDDFTDPWTPPNTLLLLHGNAESSRAWYAWVPILARRFRGGRPGMRGYAAPAPTSPAS